MLNNPIIVEDGEFNLFFENAQKDSKEIKKSIRLEQNYFGVYVLALAVHENCDFNKKIEITTDIGTPLTPEVHDTVRDLYYLEGLDVFDLGHIPVSYRLFCDECDWDTHVPLPFSVIKRYLTKEKKINFNKWKNKFEKENLKIKFIQFLES